MNEDLDELTPQERRAFDSLTKKVSPPPFLEERVVDALKDVNLIRSPVAEWWPKFAKAGIAVAAALVLMALGVVLVARWLSVPQTSPQAEFMLVLRSAPRESRATSSDEVMKRVKEYSNWARAMREKGMMVGGEKLKDEARVLTVTDGRVSVVESQGLPDNPIAGYFLIHAQDFREATVIAQDCPHLRYGGTIEVRRIERF
jgi:hypothetical protein